ncbi:hypothetical protein EUZ85_26145 [Hahella sp. KA22]|uniref:hypothetical protein n=1 Tax=Hahella sp. KA22 TaxID=1628392 RepID=UPI000FDE5521|nr:hypothetical protein [Hahella sp. KA22]AZZ94015.1 hypothetical protein ENC22_23560 [Hahella sp. KA22]QAY57389.1 hypothetical protein EUZ85_26145 [Hahella sp. KA22]
MSNGKSAILKLASKVSLFFTASALIALYGLAIYTFIAFGRWPSYGNPESWSYLELGSKAFFLLACFFIVSYGLAVLGLLAEVAKCVLSYRAKIKASGFPIKTLISLSIFLIYLIDLAGLLNWFLD